MNMSPQQIGEMSMWQYSAMLDGMSDDGEGLAAGEADELWDWLQAKDGN